MGWVPYLGPAEGFCCSGWALSQTAGERQKQWQPGRRGAGAFWLESGETVLEGEVGGVKYAGQLFLILSPGFLESRDPSMALVFSPGSTCAKHRRPGGHKTAIKNAV